LIESTKHPIGSFVDKAKSKFPKSSVIYATNRNIQEVLKVVNRPPALSPAWLVIITLRDLSEDIVKSLSTGTNVSLYVLRSRDAARELASVMDSFGIKYNVVDNLSPTDETLISHLKEELGVDEDVARYLLRRTRRSLTKISEAIEALRGIQHITRDVVKKHTDNKVEVSLYSFFDYIIGVPERISEAKAVSVVRKFKYALDFLSKFVLTRMENYLKVYDYILDGKLSLENYKYFYEDHKSEFKDFNEGSLKYAIESFSYVSYDKLYYLYLMYQREKEAGMSVIRFLNLLRLSQ
jgi:hypothetical protein